MAYALEHLNVLGGYVDWQNDIPTIVTTSSTTPTGDTQSQILYWDTTEEKWLLLDPPSSGGDAVLVWRAADGSLEWVQADSDYKVFQRKEDDTLGFDYTRVP